MHFFVSGAGSVQGGSPVAYRFVESTHATWFQVDDRYHRRVSQRVCFESRHGGALLDVLRGVSCFVLDVRASVEFAIGLDPTAPSSNFLAGEAGFNRFKVLLGLGSPSLVFDWVPIRVVRVVRDR